LLAAVLIYVAFVNLSGKLYKTADLMATCERYKNSAKAFTLWSRCCLGYSYQGSDNASLYNS